MKNAIIAVFMVWASTGAAAQELSNTPLPVSGQNDMQAPRLPANTEVLLKMNQEVTTKGKRWNEDDTFNLTVVHDVRYGDYIVIPKGSRGVGRITWLTNKGAFGKSGKMDIELEYVEVAGRRIDLEGTYRQEGEGNTLATVGGVLAAGVFAGFITGKSGRIPRGRELMATTESDIILALPNSPQVQPAQTAIPPQGAPPPATLPVQSAANAKPTKPAPSTQPVTSDRLKKKSPIRCETC